MRITDVKVTVWEWKNIPPTRYTLRVSTSASSAKMALVRVITDQGIEGHAFLGSALSVLGIAAYRCIDRLSPILSGHGPLA